MFVGLNSLQTFYERVGALRHLPRFIELVWQSSPPLTLASLGLRLLRAVLPVLVLYVGKLIVDAVVAEASVAHPAWSLAEWIASGRLTRLSGLVALELCLG